MINYTNLQTLKTSEVPTIFIEKIVTADTFAGLVESGLYTAYSVPTDATMLKFRYYSPSGDLIEQTNVPIVKDGTNA